MGNWKPSLRVNVGDRHDGDEEESNYEPVRAEPKVRFENEKESEELACPFCPEDFDVIGLCCHIDADHCVETEHGSCPLCLAKVDVNMAEHLITEHETFLKSMSIKAVKSTKSRSEFALMRKQFQDNFLHLITEPPRVDSSTPGYLSFSNINPQRVETYDAAQLGSSSGSNLPSESYINDCSERIQQPKVADTDKEITKRCEFLQELVLSTFPDEF